MNSKASANLNCNFCGKSQKEVKKLIAGPGVYICDECIELCNDIIQDDVSKSQTKATLDSVPKPHEIKSHLDSIILGPKDIHIDTTYHRRFLIEFTNH